MPAQYMPRVGTRPLQSPKFMPLSARQRPLPVLRVGPARPAACSSAAPALCVAASQRQAARPLAPIRGSLRCHAAQAGALPAQPAPVPAPAPAPIGFKWRPALIAIALGAAVKLLVPAPEGITPQGWSLFCIFITTIVGLVLGPLPVGGWAFCMLTATLVTKTLTFKAAMAAMTNEVIWLIVVSFFFAKGFEKTGLGERIANLFVMAMGKSTLGLAYGLMIAETILSPAMPSSTARAGGIFMPIIKFLSKAAGSEPDDPSRKRLGAYLVQSQLQCSLFSSAVFLTSGGQNLLCMEMGAKLGAAVDNAWVTWFVGALPPAIIGLALTPYLLYKLYPPEVTDTPEAPTMARKALQDMGPMSRDEKVMLGVILVAVVLWVGGEAIGVSAVVAAMLGLSALLVTGVLSWRDCLEYAPAWDTLFWFAVLIGMSGALNDAGLIALFADMMGQQLSALQMGWIPCFIILNLAFFVIHYLFAGQTAHIASLFPAFLCMCMAAGAPPMLSCLVLAYNGNLFGNITHFASGQSAIYYGAGYCSLGEYFYLGAVFGFLSLALYLGVGMPWWKFLGWW